MPPMEEFSLHFQLFGDGVWTASRQIGMIYWAVASAWLG